MIGTDVAQSEIHRLFSENIRRIMDETGVTQAELGRRLGKGRQYVWNVLNGPHEPGLSIVVAFADALGCRAFELLAEEKIAA